MTPQHPAPITDGIVRDLSTVDTIGYLRVSTDSQATEDRTSLEDQRRAILARALKLGRTVGAWFTDDGYSGATVQKRPDFRSLLASCEAHSRPEKQPGYVLALNDSRWGRFPDPEESGFWRFYLQRLGWRVMFAEGDEVEDPLARGVMRFVGAAQASEYRLNLQRNTRRGMRGTAERGLWSRREPYGYRRRVVVGRERILEPGERKAERERVALVPHAAEARIVRELFDLYASGTHSLRSLMRWVKQNAPGRIWSLQAVQGILRNQTYCGDVLSGRRCSDRDGYGKRDAHPALVTRDLFNRAQARLAENRKHPRSPKSPWPLSGLVTCSHCGEPYVSGGLGSRRKDGTRVQFYADRGGRDEMKGGKRCDGRTGCVSKHLLDDAVISTIADVLSKPATKRRVDAAIDRYLGSATDRAESAQNAAKAELARLEKRRDNLVAAVADGTLERQEAAPQLTAVRAEIEAATERVQRLAFERRQATMGTAERDTLVTLAADFVRTVRALPPTEVRELVKPWLSNATFDKVTRELTVAIRRVPAVPGLILSHSPGQGKQEQDVIVRRMVIGGRR